MYTMDLMDKLITHRKSEILKFTLTHLMVDLYIQVQTNLPFYLIIIILLNTLLSKFLRHI